MRARLALAIVIVIAGCRTPRSGSDGTATLAGAHGDATDNGKADITQKLRLDLDELSGFDAYADGNKLYFTAIGDAEQKIVFAKFDEDFSDKKVDAVKTGGNAASQWEGVAIDGKGRIFVLEESPGTIFVFDPDAKKVLQRIKLDFGGGSPENSLGEGLILLRNSHILVLKEKKPALLIEFGPRGDAPQGVTETEITGKNEEFWLQDGDKIEYKPLKTWEFDTAAQELMVDFSDIAIGPGGKLFVLSDESGRIGRLEGKLKVDEGKATIKAYWDLPKKIEHPEALVFLGDTPVVGIDSKGDKDNVFVLAPLQGE